MDWLGRDGSLNIESGLPVMRHVQDKSRKERSNKDALATQQYLKNAPAPVGYQGLLNQSPLPTQGGLLTVAPPPPVTQQIDPALIAQMQAILAGAR